MYCLSLNWFNFIFTICKHSSTMPVSPQKHLKYELESSDLHYLLLWAAVFKIVLFPYMKPFLPTNFDRSELQDYKAFFDANSELLFDSYRYVKLCLHLPFDT